MWSSLIFIICVSLIPEAPASSSFMQMFATGMASEAQVADDMAGQYTKLAKCSSDFDMFPDFSKQAQKNFTLEDVSRCSGQQDGCLLLLYKDSVLNLTDFAPQHYGGSDVLWKYAGKDASAAMQESGMPQEVFDNYIQKFCVGKLGNTDKK